MADSRAYISGFKHDIFVSYAHVDNLPDPGVEEGWVTTLVHGLETKLAQKLGRREAYNLWMDPRLSRDAHLTPQIKNILRDTATLLVILSPGYIASEWCEQERKSFLEFTAGRVHAAWPIFIVEKDQVEERPAEFADIIGHSFWVESRDRRHKRTLGTPKPDPSDQRYYDKLNELSEAIVTKLRELKQHVASEAESGVPELPSVAPVTGLSVFLAEATDDLDDEHNYIKDALMQAGLRVLPEGGGYPPDAAAFQEAIQADLRQCTLFLQLLSASRGKRPEGYVQLQYDQAVAAGLPILQWRNANLNVSAIRHEQHCALLQQDTVRTSSLDDFVQESLKMVQTQTEAPPVAGAQMIVFLAEATDDLELEYEGMRSYLTQAQLQVLPDAAMAYSHEVAAFQQQIAQDMAHCDLFVQLVGRSRGRRPDGYVRLQYECAVQAHKPILQWRHPTLEMTDVPADLRPLLEGSTIYAMGLEAFKREVRDKVEALQRAQAQPAVLRDAFVFVNADKQDLQLAQDVGELLRQQGLAYALPLRSGTPAKMRKDLEENLLHCDALVIVYGSITPDWVRRQLLLLRKMQGQRPQRLRALALCEGPPQQKSPVDFVLPNTQVIDCRDGFNAHKFQPFLTCL